MNYKEIKKELLKNKNIYNVSINSTRKLIEVKPIQNKDFYNLTEPLEEYYCYKNGMEFFQIGNKNFKIVDYSHFNTLIYYITLKEI